MNFYQVIIPAGQYIKCRTCGKPIKDNMAMLHEGEFYCFHDFLNVDDAYICKLEEKTCLIKEI